MENFWILYWVTRLDSANAALISFILIFALLWFVAAFVLGFNLDRYGDKEIAKTSKKWLIIFSTLFTLTTCAKVLVPTKEDAMLIAAGVGITEAVKSETAQRIASKSVSIVEKWLDKQINEQEKEKK